MVGITNSFTEGQKHIIGLIDQQRENPFSKDVLYINHLARLPYELEDNKICPFCTNMIKRSIDNGNRKRGYPFNEDNYEYKIGKYQLSVTTRISAGSIEHFISLISDNS